MYAEYFITGLESTTHLQKGNLIRTYIFILPQDHENMFVGTAARKYRNNKTYVSA